jgi:hypothetical protein
MSPLAQILGGSSPSGPYKSAHMLNIAHACWLELYKPLATFDRNHVIEQILQGQSDESVVRSCTKTCNPVSYGHRFLTHIKNKQCRFSRHTEKS